MKKVFILAAAILAAVSCSKDFSLPEVPVKEDAGLMRIEIPATLDEATKTLLTNNRSVDRQVYWCEGDALTVFDSPSEASGHKFDGELDAEDPTKASFVGDVHEDASHVFALYPYDANARISNGVITTTLAAAQNATLDSFANGAALAYAWGEVKDRKVSGLNFTNLCSVIAFKTPSYLDGARSVTVSAKGGAAMAGTVTIDCESGAITSVNGPSSVTLGVNALASGSTYYVTIAPGTYTDGFSFTVTTRGGSTYTAQTTKTVEAEAGEIYLLGTVGLVLTQQPGVTLTHTYSSGVLTGTTAVLSIPGLSSELAAMATWDIQLRNSDGILVRSATSPEGTMTVENGYTYLPKGDYTLTTAYTLNNNGSVKTRTLADYNAVSPAPSLSVTIGGYTSYDCYKGTNGQSASAATANTKDGSTVYDPTITVNVDGSLLRDSKYPHTQAFNYDGNWTDFGVEGFSFNRDGGRTFSYSDVYGDLGDQPWGQHTLDATFTFDGVTVNAPQKVWHVTGLPWSDSAPGKSGFWTWEKHCQADGNSIKIGKSLSGSLTATSCSFYCPANIDVALATNVKIETSDRLVGTNGVIVKIGGTEKINKDGKAGTLATVTYDLSANGTLSTSNSALEYTEKKWATNSFVWINSASLRYR